MWCFDRSDSGLECPGSSLIVPNMLLNGHMHEELKVVKVFNPDSKTCTVTSNTNDITTLTGVAGMLCE